MSLTSQESDLMEKRETELTSIERDCVDDVIAQVHFTTQTYGVPAAKDDRLAQVEAAIVRYILASRKPS